MNTLYYGDCLTIMQQEMAADSVDLIYLDPPFNSKRNYHTIYKDHTGNPLPEQVEAFCDQWVLDGIRRRAIRDMQTTMLEARAGIEHHSAKLVHSLLEQLQDTQPKLAAYLAYMTERLVWMKKVLKRSGSIYLHCDPTASHYVKMVMDAIFGHQNFRNEIVWCYSTSGRSKKTFAKKHDIILFYSKSRQYTWTNFRIPVSQKYLDSHYRQVDEKGRRCRIRVDAGKTRIYYPEDGMICNDWWDIPYLNSQSKERLDYPTQKPLALLERIIKASSNPGDLVFDPFCGCATTIEAAHRLGRGWAGCDIAIHAIKRVAKVRLQQRLGLREGRHYAISGIPHSPEGARDLWRRDPYHFQQWCVEEVDGFVTSKRSADGGIDGRIYFEMNRLRRLQNMILEVKGGRSVPISSLRALIGTLETSDAKMAGLILMEELGTRKQRNFMNEIEGAGSIEINGRQYPRVQMLTVAQILRGQRFDTPNVRGRSADGYRQVLLPEA